MKNLGITAELLEEKKRSGDIYCDEDRNWQLSSYEIDEKDGPWIKKCKLRFSSSGGFIDRDKVEPFPQNLKDIELDSSRPLSSEEQEVLDWLKTP